MVYMSGDNFLSEMVTKNLGLLKSIGSTHNVNIIILMDQEGDENSKLCKVEFRQVNETPLQELNYVYTNELDTALSKIVEHNNDKKIDIIGFDACSMGMQDVFYQIKDYADIAVASEKDIPERVWPYYYIVEPLTRNPDMYLQPKKSYFSLIGDLLLERSRKRPTKN